MDIATFKLAASALTRNIASGNVTGEEYVDAVDRMRSGLGAPPVSDNQVAHDMGRIGHIQDLHGSRPPAANPYLRVPPEMNSTPRAIQTSQASDVRNLRAGLQQAQDVSSHKSPTYNTAGQIIRPGTINRTQFMDQSINNRAAAPVGPGGIQRKGVLQAVHTETVPGYRRKSQTAALPTGTRLPGPPGVKISSDGAHLGLAMWAAFSDELQKIALKGESMEASFHGSPASTAPGMGALGTTHRAERALMAGFGGKGGPAAPRPMPTTPVGAQSYLRSAGAPIRQRPVAPIEVSFGQ